MAGPDAIPAEPDAGRMIVRRPARGVALLAAGVLAWGLGALAIEALPFGPLTLHMAHHILLMNVMAPLAALAVSDMAARGHGLSGAAGWAGSTLGWATLVQLGLLFAWHAPPAMAAVHASPAVAALAGLSLFAAALWFWVGVLAQAGAQRWRAIVALLVTGKLFCMLAALLAFAPRALYPAMAHAHGGPSGLADQQLAGLVMLAACPLVYVLAGVVAAALWLRDLSRDARA